VDLIVFVFSSILTIYSETFFQLITFTRHRGKYMYKSLAELNHIHPSSAQLTTSLQYLPDITSIFNGVREVINNVILLKITTPPPPMKLLLDDASSVTFPSLTA
jgi:hypothetical protein